MVERPLVKLSVSPQDEFVNEGLPDRYFESHSRTRPRRFMVIYISNFCVPVFGEKTETRKYKGTSLEMCLFCDETSGNYPHSSSNSDERWSGAKSARQTRTATKLKSFIFCFFFFLSLSKITTGWES